MAWFIITITSYFLGAGANILDKFLLGSKRISSAPVYAFYVGIFGAWSLMFAPFGLSWPSFSILKLSLIGGVFFLFGIMLLYFAIEKAQASRVIPVVGVALPLTTFALSKMSGAEKLDNLQIMGILLLIFGGLLISFDLPLRLGKKKFFSGFYYAIGAGIIMGISHIIFKRLSLSQNFINWYIWTRVGAILGAVILLIVPMWRAKIFKSFAAHKHDKKKTYKTGAIFVGNKIIGGASTILFSYAITLGSVTLTNALVSIQYAFVLLLAWVVSQKYHEIFDEKLYFWDWFQKIAAIFLIAIGMFFVV